MIVALIRLQSLIKPDKMVQLQMAADSTPQGINRDLV